MKRIMCGLWAAIFCACGIGNAAIVTLNVQGSYSSTGVASIDDGLVTGQISFDDALDVGGLGPMGAFDLLSMQFNLSGGLSFSLADDPFARAITDRASGEVVELEIFATGLAGLGFSDLGAASDIGMLSFFIFDGSSQVIAEGTFSLTPVPIPALGAAFPAFLAAAVWLRRRRS